MKRAPEPQPDLRAAIRVVERLALAPFTRIRHAMPKSYFGPAYDRWLRRQREVTGEVAKALSAEGVFIGETRDLVTVAYCGIRASSTTGLQGALRNWKAAAEKRLAGGQ
ncbi:MAG: hypothetical protein IE933_03460 [Sphingomonadales bacterium]|nr:hypothetical protein [Sphingomonadales bacterium]MBD3772099.1 hypothetical protein [Paracoccaceae bacterium]